MTTFEQWIDINIFVLKESADRLKTFIEAQNTDGMIIQGHAMIKQINSFWEYVERIRHESKGSKGDVFKTDLQGD